MSKLPIDVQETSNSQSNTEQERNAGNITIPYFKLSYRAIGTKQHGAGTSSDMWTDETESKPQKSTHAATPFDFQQRSQKFTWRKEPLQQ